RLDVRHAGKRLDDLPSPAVDLGAGEWWLLSGELKRERDPTGLDRQSLDEPEGDDILADVWIDHAPEGRQNRVLREPTRLASAEKSHRASLYGTGQRGSSKRRLPRDGDSAHGPRRRHPHRSPSNRRRPGFATARQDAEFRAPSSLIPPARR